MRFHSAVIIGLIVLVLTAGRTQSQVHVAGAPLDDSSGARITATTSPRLTARVVSSRLLGAQGNPSVTGASGIIRANGINYIIQDDSTFVVAQHDDGTFEKIRLFQAINGSDRFHEALGNKSWKPDIEAACVIPLTAGQTKRLGFAATEKGTHRAVLVLGSGSNKELRRDRVALIGRPGRAARGSVLQYGLVVVADPRELYAAFRHEEGLTFGAMLNLEGVTTIDDGRSIRFFNRGNAGSKSITTSVDVPTAAFVDYLIRVWKDPQAKLDFTLSKVTVYDLGRSNGHPISIGDAVSLPVGIGASLEHGLLYACIAEATDDPTLDGPTSGSCIALHLASGELLIAPLLGDADASSLKVEGLALVDSQWRTIEGKQTAVLHLVGVVDADSKDPQTPSLMVNIELHYQPDTRSGRR